jgi:hypothetical protein
MLREQSEAALQVLLEEAAVAHATRRFGPAEGGGLLSQLPGFRAIESLGLDAAAVGAAADRGPA